MHGGHAELRGRLQVAGQVVDANALESTAALMGLVHGLRAAGRWSLEQTEQMIAIWDEVKAGERRVG